MKVVQADGTITKSGGQVVKNVSGYDMSRLHIGGLGTLGIISEVAFKLTPVPKTQATVVALFETYDAALAAAIDIFQSALPPCLWQPSKKQETTLHATDPLTQHINWPSS